MRPRDKYTHLKAMSKERRHKQASSRATLPLPALNKLRGSRQPFQTLSELRSSLPQTLLPALVSAIPRFPQNGLTVVPRFGTPFDRFRDDIPLFNPTSIKREIDWAVAMFQAHSMQISEFVQAKKKLEDLLLVGDFNEASSVIERIESTAGFSICIMDLKIAHLQLSLGLEAQKTYSRSLAAGRKAGMVSMLSYFSSWRNEETSDPRRFKKEIPENTAKWNVRSAFREYVLFRTTGEFDYATEENASTLLRYDQSYSIVDFYETFVCLAVLYSSDAKLAEFSHFADRISELADEIVDPRLAKIAFLKTAAPQRLDACVNPDWATEDAYLRGQLESVIDSSLRRIEIYPGDLRTRHLAAIARIKLGVPITEGTGIGALIDRTLSSIVSKVIETDQPMIDTDRIALNWRYLGHPATLDAIVERYASSSPLANTALQLRAFCGDSFVDPEVMTQLPATCRSAFGKWMNLNAAGAIAPKFYSSNTIPNEETLAPAIQIEKGIQRARIDGKLDEALNLSYELNHSQSVLDRRIAARWIAHLRLSRQEIREAVRSVATACVIDKNSMAMMPVAECAAALDATARRELASDVATPIILDIYTRNFDGRYESERNYAYEDFLLSHGATKPSQLKENFDALFGVLFIYYLRYICVPEVMQSSIAFGSQRELEEERLAVCAMLAEMDPAHLEVYEEESREVTRKLVVRRGVREVEQSKIFVDTNAIRRWAEKNLREKFARYAALVQVGFDVAALGIEEAIINLISGAKVSEEYLHFPKDETSELLVGMVSALMNECLTSSEHGLDCYLSMRIRHGALAGQLRAPLEKEHIICQREGPRGLYTSNEFWTAHYWHWNQSDFTTALDARLRKFSEEFDQSIEHFAAEYIQIRTSEKPLGMFDTPISALFIRILASNISERDMSFEDFVELCLSIFWTLLGKCLIAINNTIDENIAPDLDRLFSGLRSDVRSMARERGKSIDELDSALVKSQTGTRQALQQVKSWFILAKPVGQHFFSFDELIEIGLECVRNIHPEFSPSLKTRYTGEIIYFDQLPIFSDIFFIVFDNIRKHSGEVSPNVRIAGILESDRLQIEIHSDVCQPQIQAEHIARVELIHETIRQAQGGYLRAVRSEGGTGLIKLRNILRRGSEPSHLDFGFSDNSFYVKMEVPLVLVLTPPEAGKEGKVGGNSGNRRRRQQT